MNNNTIRELKSLISKMNELVDGLASQEIAHKPGMPRPDLGRRVELGICEIWDTLKSLSQFTAHDVQARIQDSYCKKRDYSNYSAILSEWAKAGHLEIVKRGSGPRPTVYKISK